MDELIQAARVPVFLLDERQVVRPSEIGSVDEIRLAAKRHGAELITIRLDGQFRAAGSAGYLEWVESLLGFDGRSPQPWIPEVFELSVATTPDELEGWVGHKSEEGYTARLSAGFCWPWSDPDNGTLVEDVVVGDWRHPWNVKGDRPVGNAPSASLWATDPMGIGQVGCIYTAQGFEYDFNGVIFGPDLVWRRDRWVADPQVSHDTVVRRDAAGFDRLIRHTYKVLLTRGLLGCCLYSTDEETREFLDEMAAVPSVRGGRAGDHVP